jgi:hypothetical protein
LRRSRQAPKQRQWDGGDRTSLKCATIWMACFACGHLLLFALRLLAQARAQVGRGGRSRCEAQGVQARTCPWNHVHSYLYLDVCWAFGLLDGVWLRIPGRCRTARAGSARALLLALPSSSCARCLTQDSCLYSLKRGARIPASACGRRRRCVTIPGCSKWLASAPLVSRVAHGRGSCLSVRSMCCQVHRCFFHVVVRCGF